MRDEIPKDPRGKGGGSELVEHGVQVERDAGTPDLAPRSPQEPEHFGIRLRVELDAVAPTAVPKTLDGCKTAANEKEDRDDRPA